MTQPSEGPIVVAPMAGGPSTPALVAAVVRAGGGGFLAGGMKSPSQVRHEVDRLRELLGSDARRWGVNLFVPDACNTAVPAEARTDDARAERLRAVNAYRDKLVPVADALGAELPTAADATPDPEREALGFAEMIALAIEQAWPQVTFTFGLPRAEVFVRLADARIRAGVTVTSATEASDAVAAGAKFLVVQGNDAGGHRATLNPLAEPGTTDLVTLLGEVRAAVGADIPLVAAGGVSDAERVRELLDAGASEVSVGTLFLLTPEAGTSATYRLGLVEAAANGTNTALTRAFSGRWACGVANAFMAELADAPAAYPEVNALTKNIRAKAAAAGDAERLSVWAGTGFARARSIPAADVVALLTP